MKQLGCILILVFLKITLQAQQLFVIDQANSPVNALIEVTNIEDKSKVQQAAENGVYIFPAPGSYRIKVHALGYDDYINTLRIAAKEIHQIVLIKTSVTVDDVVVTAQLNTKSPKNSVIPIKVIDSKKILLMGAQNLRDVLTNETGLRLSQDNILGSSVSVQGLSGENVKILIDGVPVIGRQNGNIDLSQLDLSNVERIEIVEGPMNVNYGTNALGGVINIITKKGSQLAKNATIRTYYETIGTYNLGVTANTHVKKLTVQLNASRNFFDGWSATDRFEAIPAKHLADINRFKTWKPKEQYNAGINLGYKFKYLDIRYKTLYFNEFILNRGMPRAPYLEDAFDDTYRTNRFDNVIIGSYHKTAKKFWNTQTGYNIYKRVKNSYHNDLTCLNKILTANLDDQDTTNFNLLNSRTSRISYFKNLNYEIGTDINIESTTGKRIKNNAQALSDIALFAVGEYVVTDQLTLRGGLRAAYNSGYKAPLLPSINAKWFINSKNIVRISVAQGFKAPGLKELYFYFVDFNHNITGNSELKAEKSNSVNIQYNYVAMKKNALVKFEAKFFYNYIQNLITLAQINGLSYSYANIGLYKTKGITLNSDITIKNFKINTGVNYTGRYNQLAETMPVANFNFSPEISTAISYNLPKQKTQFTLFYKFNGKLPAYFLDSKNNLVLQEVGSYHWADLTVTKTFYKTITISTGIKNLFNVQNVSATNGTGVHQSDNRMAIGAGRFYFMGLNYILSR